MTRVIIIGDAGHGKATLRAALLGAAVAVSSKILFVDEPIYYGETQMLRMIDHPVALKIERPIPEWRGQGKRKMRRL